MGKGGFSAEIHFDQRIEQRDRKLYKCKRAFQAPRAAGAKALRQKQGSQTGRVGVKENEVEGVVWSKLMQGLCSPGEDRGFDSK